MEVDDNSLETRISMAVERVHNRLKAELDGAVADYNKLVNDTNAFLRDKFERNNKEMKTFIDEKLDTMKAQIAEERRKLDTLVEGRCQAYTIEIERKLLARLNATMQEN